MQILPCKAACGCSCCVRCCSWAEEERRYAFTLDAVKGDAGAPVACDVAAGAAAADEKGTL